MIRPAHTRAPLSRRSQCTASFPSRRAFPLASKSVSLASSASLNAVSLRSPAYASRTTRIHDPVRPRRSVATAPGLPFHSPPTVRPHAQAPRMYMKSLSAFPLRATSSPTAPSYVPRIYRSPRIPVITLAYNIFLFRSRTPALSPLNRSAHHICQHLSVSQRSTDHQAPLTLRLFFHLGCTHIPHAPSPALDFISSYFLKILNRDARRMIEGERMLRSSR